MTDTILNIFKNNLSSYNLSNEQYNAIINCINYNRVMILGRAGTGKSFLVNILYTIFVLAGMNVELCASTGIASQNINGCTIHKLAKIPILFQKKFNERELSQKLELTDKLNRADVVIIDEISMLNIEDFNYFMKCIEQKTSPTKIILIGDFHQLPCVVTPNIKTIKSQSDIHLEMEEYQYLLPFSLSFSKINWNINLLNIPQRCNNIEYNKLVNQLADNIFDKHINSMFQSTKVEDDLYKKLVIDNYTYLATNNKTVDHINNKCLDIIPGVEQIYEGDENFICKFGMKVMFLVNDKSESPKYFNGTIGYIYQMKKDSVIVSIKDSKEKVSVGYHTFTEIEYDYIANKYKQGSNSKYGEDVTIKDASTITRIPLRAAYALTVHKSQGLTLPKVIINPDAIFSSGLLYTMLTRTKSPSDIILTRPLVASDMKNYSAISKLYDHIEKTGRLYTEEELINIIQETSRKKQLYILQQEKNNMDCINNYFHY